MDGAEYAIVTTACADEEEGARIANALLEGRLAACVQMFPVNSRFFWSGELRESKETLLLIKCRRDRYADIERTILENHSYELPEILLTPVEAGYGNYLKWIDET